jgi:hypothetical protein
MADGLGVAVPMPTLFCCAIAENKLQYSTKKVTMFFIFFVLKKSVSNIALNV